MNKELFKHPLYNSYKKIKSDCSWDDYDSFYEWAIKLWKPRSFIVKYNSLWIYCPENCTFDIKKKKSSVKKVKLNFNKPVICTCDYCGELVEKKFYKYKKSLEIVCKIACSKPKCKLLKREETNLVIYGIINPHHSIESQEKQKATLLAKYGVDNPNKSPEIREKSKQTNIEKYGVENPFQSEKIKEKIKKTNLEKYGCEYTSQVEKFKEKQKQTIFKKYGVEKPLQRKEFLDKAKQTTFDRYGVDSFSKTEEFKQKMDKKYRIYNGKTLRELSKESGKSYTTFTQQKNKFGVEYAIETPLHQSTLEKKFSEILDELNITYEKQYIIDKYRCDFKIDNILIEVDGLYWHSEKCVKDNYHINKKKYLNGKGYQVLFFRENEVHNKTEIIKSILLNKLGQSNKIFARKTAIEPISKKEAKEFLSTNHLMGSGKGDSVVLKYGNEIVAIMRYYIQSDIIHVSRFCTKLNTSVVGGYSKLLNYIRKQPHKGVVNFVDGRYGNGKYLEKLGFKLQRVYPSFMWTDYKDTYHRMKFPKNTGYDHKLCKIWDAGQLKWVL